jgi:hypothetical protein
MNSLLMIALLQGAPTVPDSWVDAVGHVETGGEKDPDNAVGDAGRAKGRYQFWEVAWIECSKIRAKHGQDVHPYSKATDPVISKEYARTWIAMCQRGVSLELGRPATLAETWACFNRGLTGFRRLGFKLYRMPKHTQKNIAYLSKIK